MATSEKSNEIYTVKSTFTAKNIAKALIKKHNKHFRDKNYCPLQITLDQIDELAGGSTVNDTSIEVINDELLCSGYSIIGLGGRMYVVTDEELAHYSDIMSGISKSINLATEITMFELDE